MMSDRKHRANLLRRTRIVAASFAALGGLFLGLAFSAGVDVKLSAGDRVAITVFGHVDLSGEFEIDALGGLSLPLIGDVPAEGITPDELQQAVVDELQPEFLINPRVTVQLLSFRPFYILGEVNVPGSYPYVGGMTVVSAVAEAGGFTPRARTNRLTIRRTVDGVQTEVLASRDMEIQAGDVIEVPERFF